MKNEQIGNLEILRNFTALSYCYIFQTKFKTVSFGVPLYFQLFTTSLDLPLTIA